MREQVMTREWRRGRGWSSDNNTEHVYEMQGRCTRERIAAPEQRERESQNTKNSLLVPPAACLSFCTNGTKAGL